MFKLHKKHIYVIVVPDTVGTIDIGTNLSEPTLTNLSEPTSECGLGNRENAFEPTTPLPSPQYGKSQSSKICGTFC